MNNTTLHIIGRDTFDSYMQDYPMSKQWQRQYLNDNIFGFYEYLPISISQEEIWLSYLKARMNIIMPKYNLLYDSLELVDKIDPLMTYEGWNEHLHDGTKDSDEETTKDYNKDNTSKTTDEGYKNYNKGEYQTVEEKKVEDDDWTSKKNSTENTITDSNDLQYHYFSDTPQGNLVDENKLQYLTTWNKDTDVFHKEVEDVYSDTQSGTDDKTTTTDRTTKDDIIYKETNGNVKDYTANEKYGDSTTDEYHYKDHDDDKDHKLGTDTDSLSTLISKYRELSIDIDRQIIMELDDLFATVFDIADLFGSALYQNEPERIPFNPFIYT